MYKQIKTNEKIEMFCNIWQQWWCMWFSIIIIIIIITIITGLEITEHVLLLNAIS